MSCYGIYNTTTGAINRIVTIDQASLAVNVQDGESAVILLHDEADDNHYVVNGVVTPFPVKPAPYYTFNFAAQQWQDQRTVAQAQISQWGAIKVSRDNAIAAGFTFNGNVYDSDQVSQSRIQGAVQLAQIAAAANQPFSIVWTLLNNTTVTLSGSDVVSLGLALGTFVQTQYSKGVYFRNQINAATTNAQVMAITWS